MRDLLNRLFAHYQSSLTGLALTIITFLTDHGINLSEDNAKIVTAKIVLWGVALVKFCSKDAGKVDPPVPVSSLRGGSAFGLIGLVLLTTLGTGCDWFKGKTTTHKVAIATANATTTLGGVTESVEVLRVAGKLSADGAKDVHNLDKKVNEAIDLVRQRAKTGYDKKDLLGILSKSAEDVAAAEQRGIVSITDPSDKLRFQETIALLKFGIDTLKQIIESNTAPAPPVGTARSVMQEPQSPLLYLTQLVGIARDTYFTMWRQSKLDQTEAFAEGDTRTRDLRDRLDALTK